MDVGMMSHGCSEARFGASKELWEITDEGWQQ
jgi:hypothetical protein